MWRMRGLLLPLLLTALCVQHGSAQSPFKVGIVSSATGNLTDWHEGVSGFQVFKARLDQQSGFTIQDNVGNSFQYSFEIDMRDDGSDRETHTQLLEDLVDNQNVDFVVNSQPAFADEEARFVSGRGRLNLHGATSNEAVFERGLPYVFGVAQPHSRYFPNLFKQFTARGVGRIAVMYRKDVLELNAACKAAIRSADNELLPVQDDVGYTSSHPDVMQGLAEQLAGSSAEALVACSLTHEAQQLIDLIHKMEVPMKAMVFTNGPADLSFLEDVGSLSKYLLTPVYWHKEVPYKDSFFGTAKEYSVFYDQQIGKQPTHIAAGTSATGLLLKLALETAFQACDISATGGDAHTLLYVDGSITCDDNQNLGVERVRQTLSQISKQTFFGDTLFGAYQQNIAGEVLTLQVFEKQKDLQTVLAPTIVLPLKAATNDLKLPQPNRYEPVCSSGSHQNPNPFEPCISCEKGTFQDQEGQERCQLCFKDHYTNKTGSASCDMCPANSQTEIRGASSIEQCYCKLGHYTQEGKPGTPCLPCPDHATCAGGTDPPRNKEGWHAEEDMPYEMYDCNPGFQCTGNFTCAEGYTGRMCASCDVGYFKAFGLCMPCISPAGNVIVMLLMYGLFIFLVVVLSRHMDNIHLLMNFCQTVAIMSLFNLRWPHVLEVIFNIAGVLSFEMNIIQPQCIAPEWGFAENLYIQLAWPAFLLIMMVTWTGLTHMAYRAKLRMQGKSVDDFASSSFSSSFGGNSGNSSKFLGSGAGGSGTYEALDTSNAWLLLQGIMYIPSSPQEMHELWLERMGIVLMALNLGYVVILKYCLFAFSCADFMGTKYLYFSPDDMCFTTEHYQLMLVAAAGLVVYIGGAWFMMGNVTYTLKRYGAFGSKKPLILLGWMYERYESKYYWYELVVLVEKTAFVVCAAFLVRDPVMQVLIMLVLTFGTTLLSVKTSAPVDQLSALLMTAADGVVMFLLVLGLVFYNEQVLDRTVIFALVLALIALLGMMATLTGAFIMEIGFNIALFILMSRHKAVASKWGQDVKKHRHMYRVFKPMFLFKWLSKADVPTWQQWHRLCNYLHDHVQPTCETSYLSQKKVGYFWQYLLNSFPEMLDFLVSVEERERDEFVTVIEVMYEHYFDTEGRFKCQLNNVVTDRFRASIAQWISSASDSEVNFMRQVVTGAYSKAHGKEAEEEITRAFSRSSKSQVKEWDAEDAKLLTKGMSGLVRTSTLGGSSDDGEGGSPVQGSSFPGGGKNFAEMLRGDSNSGGHNAQPRPRVPPLALAKANSKVAPEEGGEQAPADNDASPFARPSVQTDMSQRKSGSKRASFHIPKDGGSPAAQQILRARLEQRGSAPVPPSPRGLEASPGSPAVTARNVILDTDELVRVQNSASMQRAHSGQSAHSFSSLAAAGGDKHTKADGSSGESLELGGGSKEDSVELPSTVPDPHEHPPTSLGQININAPPEGDGIEDLDTTDMVPAMSSTSGHKVQARAHSSGQLPMSPRRTAQMDRVASLSRLRNSATIEEQQEQHAPLFTPRSSAALNPNAAEFPTATRSSPYEDDDNDNDTSTPPPVLRSPQPPLTDRPGRPTTTQSNPQLQFYTPRPSGPSHFADQSSPEARPHTSQLNTQNTQSSPQVALPPPPVRQQTLVAPEEDKDQVTPFKPEEQEGGHDDEGNSNQSNE